MLRTRSVYSNNINDRNNVKYYVLSPYGDYSSFYRARIRIVTYKSGTHYYNNIITCV